MLSSDPSYIAFSLLAGDPPEGAPEMFEAVAGQRQVNFSWSPPPVTQRNGVITSYTLSCSPSPFSLPQSPSQSGTLTVAGFSPDTSYTCSLVASNSQGSGPAANTSFTTLAVCKTVMCITLYTIVQCIIIGLLCVFLYSIIHKEIVSLTTSTNVKRKITIKTYISV